VGVVISRRTQIRGHTQEAILYLDQMHAGTLPRPRSSLQLNVAVGDHFFRAEIGSSRSGDFHVSLAAGQARHFVLGWSDAVAADPSAPRNLSFFEIDAGSVRKAEGQYTTPRGLVKNLWVRLSISTLIFFTGIRMITQSSQLTLVPGIGLSVLGVASLVYLRRERRRARRQQPRSGP
jgi:hypothetical protein